MSTILDEIAAYTAERIAIEKKSLPLSKIKQRALMMGNSSGFPFERALSSSEMSFICECKKASPSKGLISSEFDYLQIAKDYEASGASCISVLTEPRWFLGQDRFLSEIAETVSVPCLRKDFTVDEYMIYQAKLLGASAVLLICSLLDYKTLKEYIGIYDCTWYTACGGGSLTRMKYTQRFVPGRVL